MSSWGEELKELTAELTHTLGKMDILLLIDSLSGSEWSVVYSWLLNNPTRSQQNNIIKMKNKRIKKNNTGYNVNTITLRVSKLLASLTRFAKVFSIHAGMIV